MALKPPCERDCPQRHVGCHAECEKYKSWKLKHDDMKKRMHMEAVLNNYSDWVECHELYHDRCVIVDREKKRQRVMKTEVRKRDAKRKERLAKAKR